MQPRTHSGSASCSLTRHWAASATRMQHRPSRRRRAQTPWKTPRPWRPACTNTPPSAPRSLPTRRRGGLLSNPPSGQRKPRWNGLHGSASTRTRNPPSSRSTAHPFRPHHQENLRLRDPEFAQEVAPRHRTAAMKSRVHALRIRPANRDIPQNDDGTLPETRMLAEWPRMNRHPPITGSRTCRPTHR
jgi:hypothetical protein